MLLLHWLFQLYSEALQLLSINQSKAQVEHQFLILFFRSRLTTVESSHSWWSARAQTKWWNFSSTPFFFKPSPPKSQHLPTVLPWETEIHRPLLLMSSREFTVTYTVWTPGTAGCIEPVTSKLLKEDRSVNHSSLYNLLSGSPHIIRTRAVKPNREV